MDRSKVSIQRGSVGEPITNGSEKKSKSRKSLNSIVNRKAGR